MLNQTLHDFWVVLRCVRLIGRSRGQAYDYYKLICLRFHVGDDIPFRIEIFKCPYHLRFIDCGVPLRIYTDSEGRVANIENCDDVSEDDLGFYQVIPGLKPDYK